MEMAPTSLQMALSSEGTFKMVEVSRELCEKGMEAATKGIFMMEKGMDMGSCTFKMKPVMKVNGKMIGLREKESYLKKTMWLKEHGII